MSRTLPLLSAGTILLAAAAAAAAEAPRVAADIAPVHSLVARVMEGAGTPDLIIPPGASPHEYSLRPSEAGALEAADLVFWIGPDLTPWLDDAIGTLADGAEVTALLGAEGTIELETREDALFEAHDDHHAEEDHDDHAGDAADGHDHGAHDPHAWLSVGNAVVWMDLIAGTLSAADPANAELYAANATAARAEIEALEAEVAETLAPVKGGRFIVFHDAYQYFEAAFDMPASGAITLSDATDASPARIAEIRDRIRDEGVDCVLAEPQYDPGLIATVLDGTAAETGILDPLGADIAPGPDMYPTLLRNLAGALAGCL